MVCIANTDNKQGRFDSIKFSEGCRFRIKHSIADSALFQKVMCKAFSWVPRYPFLETPYSMSYSLLGDFADLGLLLMFHI